MSEAVPLGDLERASDACVRPLAIDVPFAETKEQLGGIYLIEAESQEAALDVASRLGMASFGAVEVRRVVGLGLRGASCTDHRDW